MNKPRKELYESSLKLLTHLTLEQTYKVIVSEAVSLVQGAGGSVILAERGVLKRVYASDPIIKTINPQRHGRTYKSYKNKKIMTLTRNQIISVHPEFSDIKITSYILIPLINRGNSIGVLSIYKNNKSNFSSREIDLLQIFSPMASMAIRKAQLYSALNKAVETRDLFLSMASHELKTPITTIYVYLQLIQRNMKKNKKFDPDWIQTLLDEMVRLTKIVDELLELSRIKSGKLVYNYSEVNIEEIIKRALMNFKAGHKNKIIFKDELRNKDKVLIGDFDKLTEVIINILDNAAKHSPKNIPIQISLSSDENQLIVEVVDSGKGISQKEIKRVFEGFFKTLDNTKPGMGLGLYLSKQIIDAHRGKIKIMSKIGHGTTVYIYLPRIVRN